MAHPLRLAETYWRWVVGFQEATGRTRASALSLLSWYRLRHRLGPEWVARHYFLARGAQAVLEHIPNPERRALQAAATPEECRFLEHDRLSFLSRLDPSGLPVCPALGLLTDDPAAPPVEVPVARTAAELDNLLGQAPPADYILRRRGGGRGFGILPLQLVEGRPVVPGADQLELTDEGGQPLTPADFDSVSGLWRWLHRLPFRPFTWILLPRLKAHPTLAELMPGPGLGTVRIHTFLRRDGTVELRWPLLKLPAPNNIADNFRSGSSGARIAAIDLRTGELGRPIGRAAPFHPLLPVREAGVGHARCEKTLIPDWADLIRTVKTAAEWFPELPALGWDIAPTPSGPVILEANWMFGAEIIEVAYEQGIGPEVRALYASLRPSQPLDGFPRPIVQT